MNTNEGIRRIARAVLAVGEITGSMFVIYAAFLLFEGGNDLYAMATLFVFMGAVTYAFFRGLSWVVRGFAEN